MLPQADYFRLMKREAPMAAEETALAPAKVNLSLFIRSRLPDGLHRIESLMQTVSLTDELRLRWGEPGLSCHCEPALDCLEEENLAYRAALLFYRAIDKEPELSIVLRKKIPQAAGLGGGSADAAAVLHALDRRYHRPISCDHMFALAASLGSDIPFALIGGAAWVRGRGEQVTPLPPLPSISLVLAKPKESLSTASVYRALLLEEIPTSGRIEPIVQALIQGNWATLARTWRNGLFAPAVRLCPVIEEVKSQLLEAGALGTLLCGSGPTMMGLFADRRHAEKAKERLQGIDLWTQVVTSSIVSSDSRWRPAAYG
ncbi:MAG: 4-(cytidine 5'-diphospho)-2-C-methyl-D-erythritol kinase [bacterium]